MSQTLAFHSDPRPYLLVPSMPTPNGRLHLGHVAGPFLKLDVLARYLRTRGTPAHVISGIDSYESYVQLEAERTQRTPTDVAAYYTRCIIEDLQALRLDQDGLIDPLVSPGKELYDNGNQWMIERLIEVGAARPRSRRYPFSTAQGRFVPRSYMTGTCSHCHAPTSGSMCEACGHQHAPDDLIDPALRDGQGDIEWRDVSTLFMSVSDQDGLLRALDGVRMPARYKDIVRTHIERLGAQMELTIPSEYGPPWRGAAPGQVVFTYCTAFSWTLAVGELHRRLLGREHHAFHRDADVVTAISFGMDLTVAVILGTLGFAWEDGLHRAYDHYLANEFLSLHGDKFSTSRGHVISGTDLVRNTPVTSDAIRYYLATISPDDRETDFHIDTFVAIINDVLHDMVGRTVAQGLALLDDGEPPPPSSQLVQAFEEMLDRQARDFALDTYRVSAVPGHVHDWVERTIQAVRQQQDVYWFLKGLSVLAAPLMPDFAGHLWRKLGGQDVPRLATFLERTRVQPGPLEPPVPPLTRADLESCLPATLETTAATAAKP